MLVRLLGQEANARSSNYTHPFGDVPSWADPYVGYMYRYKLSQGISPHQYNPQTFIRQPVYCLCSAGPGL
ncbi:hypothetical protein [Syntrophomonas palmitatica]|uniref:hypothetical protein n=1 Tax=Syntrophomonas palmitatica TaxID=402877 RepID=UPI0006D2771C|nr:hypothetical protein [Syntrophomonas palmitatica]